MKTINKLRALVLAFLVFPVAIASASDLLNPVHLADVESMEGEPLPEFLRRVGRVLHDYTMETGWEACGAIGQRGHRYSVLLFSDRVPHGCAVRSNVLQDGYEFTGETIHSHPHAPLLNLDRRAQAWSRHYGFRHVARTLRNDGSGGFSSQDLAGGPGWLVAKGRLLHQAGGQSTGYGPVFGQ